MIPIASANLIDARGQAKRIARAFGHPKLSRFTVTTRGAVAECRVCRRLVLVEKAHKIWWVSGGATTRRCQPRVETEG